jgi:hypothetical protein
LKGVVTFDYKDKPDIFPSFDSLCAISFYYSKVIKSDNDDHILFCNNFKSNFFVVLDDAVQGYNKIKLNLINVITKETENV